MKLEAGKNLRRYRVGLLLAATLILALAVGTALRPPGPASNPPRFASMPRPGTPLRAVQAGVGQRFGDGAAGVLALDDAGEALEWVLVLFDLAEHSIDAQYFIWEDDAVGSLVLERLLAAADRGVEARVLIDDAKLKRADRRIATLDLHPNIEMRVFNPWGSRRNPGARSLEWLLNREKLNRRMHNKLLVADGSVAITGGRNIADRFFGLGDRFNVVDLDLLFAGPAVQEASREFDAFWNDGMAHPVAAPSGDVTEADLDELREDLAHARRPANFPPVRRDWGDLKQDAVNEMTAGYVQLVWDSPLEDASVPTTRVIDEIRRFAEGAREELIVSSAFVVPDEDDIDWFRRLADRGVRVRILTNSLASNIGTIAHSGYRKYRKKLLAAGVELYELRDDAAARADWRVAPSSAERLALHAKAIVVDRRRVYVGSLNLDRRSIHLNTEMGLIVDSPELAERVAEFVVRHMAPENAWRVLLDDDDRLVWQNSDRSVARQPARGGTQRVKDWLYGLLPIQNDL